MDPTSIFTADDQAAIQAAAQAAEARTSGEIVPYVVGQADGYAEIGWTGAALGALLASGLASAIFWLFGPWFAYFEAWITLPTTLGAALGWSVVGLSPWLARRLVPAATLERRVRQRAQAAFLDEEVFGTRDRTGILLFLALFEHRAVVLADTSINALVDEAEWQAIADELARGVRSGRAGSAMVEAIGRCADLLEDRLMKPSADDTDELHNVPRLRDV